MKRIFWFIVCVLLASAYIYPIFQGLILLPLDLLVTNSSPWRLAGTILLKNPYMQDSVIQMFPWRHLTFTSLTSGILPLWNPYQLMGMPFMASMKSLVFYPANLLFLLGEATSWNALLWLQLFLSLWFTYLLVASFGVKRLFAIFAAIAFAFNSLMMSVLEFGSEGHVLLWLPILLYFVKRRWFIGIIFAISFSILAGHLQYTAYVIAVTLVFALYEKTLRKVLLPVGIGMTIAAVQLLPGIEMFGYSYRGLVDNYPIFANGLLKPYHLLRLLSPDWFGNPVTLDLRGGYIESSGYFGIIPLFFALYAGIYARKNSYVTFFSIIATVALLLSFDGIGQILYFLRIPVITSGFGGRIFSMFLFSGAVLSGFGLQAFMRSRQERTKLRALLYFLLLAAICFAVGGAALANIKIQIVALVGFGVAAFLFIRYGNKFRYGYIAFVSVVLILTFGDLFRMGYRFLTFSNEKFLYPDLSVTKFIRTDTEKSLGRTYGLTEPEIDTALGIYGTETYNPLFPLRTAKLLQALEGKSGGKLADNKYYLTRNPRMKYVLDFLGVSIVAIPKGTNPAITYWNTGAFEKDITKIYEGDGTDVYRNLTAFPRFSLYWDIRDGVSDAESLQLIENQAVDFRKTLLIQEQLPERFVAGTGSAVLVSSGLNELTFEVQTDTPAVLYVSDTNFPGWHASVNGKSTPILHANYNFRAVVAPPGKSVVRFWYMPRSVIIGAVVSATGLLLAAAFIVVDRIQGGHKKRNGTDGKTGFK